MYDLYGSPEYMTFLFFVKVNKKKGYRSSHRLSLSPFDSLAEVHSGRRKAHPLVGG